MKTLGLVLCGGKSSRMGTDKGLIKKENNTWAELAFQKFERLSIPAVVSVNETQFATYKKVFPENVLVPDQYEIGGPLNGLLSVHLHNPDTDLFVLACDIIHIHPDVLQRVYDNYILRHNTHDFFVYKNKDHFEPLCGIYTSAALTKIAEQVVNGELEKYSMTNILENGNTFTLDINQEGENYFLNYNDPSLLSRNQS